MEIALILTGVLVMSRIYSEYLTRVRDELCEFRDFLEKMNLRILAYLDTGTGFVTDEEFPALRRVGFIEGVLSGDSLFDSYSKCMQKFSISKSDRALLYDFFKEYGKGDMDIEVKRTDRIIGALAVEAEAVCCEIKKKVKVFTSVTLAVCLGVVILII